jgi:polar amino acid transport system permease protein
MNDIGLFLPPLLLSAWTTIWITFVSMALASTLGLIIALARLSKFAPSRWFAKAYVDFLRGTPLLLQLFYIYYVLPYVGIKMPAIVAGILGLSLNYAAYLSEVYRTAIQAVDKGQVEAARTVGLRPLQILALVVMPQAMRIATPPLGNYFIALFKDTALVAIISVKELMFTADQLASTTYQYVAIYTLAFALYFSISYPASMLVTRLEKRMSKVPR